VRYDAPKSLDINNADFIDPSRLHRQGLHMAEYVHYTGSSMYPTFHDPEFLLLEKPSRNSLRIGDVIVFKTGHIKSLVIHRIVGRIKDDFVTKGDNNSRIDAVAVPFDSIHGRAVGILTKKGVRPVSNGLPGYLLSRFHRVRLFIKRYIIKPLVWNAFTVRSRNAVTRYLFIKPEFCVFMHVNGEQQIRLIWKNRVIGYYSLQKNMAFIKRLYRIGINRRYIERKIIELGFVPQTILKPDELPGEPSDT
jgi:hypothetical protein